MSASKDSLEPDDSHLPVAQRGAARRPGAAAPFPPVGVLDPPALPLRVSTIAVRRDDKRVFDSYSAFCEAEVGRRLTQWEAFTLLLEEAMENPGGRFAAWARWRGVRVSTRVTDPRLVSRGASSRTGGPRSSLSLSRVR